MNSISRIGRVAPLLAAPLLLAGCDSSVLTPDVETEIAEIRSGQYSLDRDHATLIWKVDHLGFSTYIGRFNDFDASLDFDPENIGNSSLEVIVNTASLDVNLPEFEDELRADWFNVEQFPQAVYRTTSLAETIDENTFVFNGELTFMGVTAPVALEVDFHRGARDISRRLQYVIGFSASASVQRSAFGLDNLVNIGIGDEVELEIHVEFINTAGES
ncbi:MAG: YceI family protein [Gammaproteobacteria bacterium]|nr:YceI family protein [Gammaproteobacteria bacterium]MYA67182.1 YceI family protein [Gammaproteobacteria bacterium]MYH45199.1 YceI family protein [Gammaproteobacteria bacterium]MYL12437.1 YceI family protein [Gammaproteobacteria bacterium]